MKSHSFNIERHLYKHKKRELWLIFGIVIVLHLCIFWLVVNLVEPFTLEAPPKVNSMLVRFVSKSNTDQQNKDFQPIQSTTATKALNRSEQRNTQSSAQTNIQKENKKNHVISSLTSERAKASTSTKTETLAEKKDQKDQPAHQHLEKNKPFNSQAQAAENSVVNADTNSSRSNPNQMKGSGGERSDQDEKVQMRAVESAVDRNEPIQVSSVDVLRFGQLKYDDRELKQQNRILLLRLIINETGQAVDIQVKQSTGIQSLDERGIQAVRSSKFKPHKINGKAVSIVVDFPIELKLGRSR
nr:energy transducer TonB [Acinetobacter sp. Marseille-Q1620]